MELFGQFVFELFDQFVYWFVGDIFELGGVVDGFFLIVFGLVDVDQVFECLWCVLIQLGQFGEYGFGMVQQVGFYVVFVQGQQGLYVLCVIQVMVIDQVLVQVDGVVDFVMMVEQMVQCDLGFEGFFVQFGDVQEQFDGFVWLFVEQVVQVMEIGVGQVVDLVVIVVLIIMLFDYLFGQCGQWYEQEELELFGDEIYF